MNGARTFAALAALLLAGAPVQATTIDPYGAVVFNQADVDAGNITPGDTPGFPASLLVSGSYRLAGPLTLTSLKNGIVISAPAVTLDLGGFKLSGGAVGRNGVYSDQIDTRIENGIIRGFTESGISDSNQNLIVDRMSVSNNGGWGIVQLGYSDRAFNSRVTNSIITGNAQYGLELGPGANVQNNTITRNAFGGVFTLHGGVVLGNVVTDNGGIGLSGNSTGFGNNTIYGNVGGPVSGTMIELQPNACSPACP